MKQYKVGQKFRYKGWIYECIKSGYAKNKGIIITRIGLYNYIHLEMVFLNDPSICFKSIKPTLLTRIKNTIKYIMHPKKNY